MKNDLRKKYFSIRSDFSAEDKSFASGQICTNFFDNIPYKEHKIIAGYHPIKGEVDSLLILEKLTSHIISLPCVKQGSKELIFRKWQKDGSLVDGKYGIKEPSSDNEILHPDLILIPMLAFDGQKHRLGYGGGYYDTTISALKKHKDILLVGLAFSCQYSSVNLDLEHHDEQLDFIVTENGVL